MIKNNNDMSQLSNLEGWTNRCDTYDTYYKKINDYEICVTKYINSTKWEVVLIEWDAHGSQSNEIPLNYNATFEWVIKLTELLTSANNSED